MRHIYLLQVLIGLAALLLVVVYFYRGRHSRKYEEKIVLNEPRLNMMDKPAILARLPENEEMIPDANARSDGIEAPDRAESKKISRLRPAG